jgi:hypothetical protein
MSMQRRLTRELRAAQRRRGGRTDAQLTREVKRLVRSDDPAADARRRRAFTRLRGEPRRGDR